MTLDNFVKLTTGVEKKLRFKPESFRIEPRTITDNISKTTKTVNAAVLDVIEEDGRPVTKTLSTLSDKFASALKVAHDNGTLYGRTVGVSKTGTGFRVEYTLKLY